MTVWESFCVIKLNTDGSSETAFTKDYAVIKFYHRKTEEKHTFESRQRKI